MRRALTWSLLAAPLVGLAACGETPPEGQYITEAPAETSAPSDSGGASAPSVVSAIAGLKMRPEESWRRVSPASSMRKAQFEVGPADQPAEVVVFHFGPGQGGSVENNLLRWARLVLDDAGEPTLPEIAEFEVNGLRVTLAAYTGTYLAGPPGGEQVAMPDWTLLAAVIEGGPEGAVFPRLVGPTELVASQRDAFERFLRSAAPARP